MIYVLGIPTHLAVGTDLFEIIISASYGTFTHALKGNVDIMIALVMHTGAAIGAQIGAIATQYFAGPKIRLAFVPLPLIGAAVVIYTFLPGTNCKAMRILICSNGMPAADQAAQLGGMLARRSQAETTLLGIAEKPSDEDDLRQALEATAQDDANRGRLRRGWSSARANR